MILIIRDVIFRLISGGGASAKKRVSLGKTHFRLCGKCSTRTFGAACERMPSIAISRQSNGNVVRCEELNDTVACFSRGTIASPGSPNLTVLKNVDEAGINSKAVQQITGFPMPEDCVPLSISGDFGSSTSCILALQLTIFLCACV